MARSEEELLEHSRIGRSRFLAALGGALFTLATDVLSPTAARATHLGDICWGSDYGRCSCCSGGDCCDQYCFQHCTCTHVHCPSGYNCWRTCSHGTLYRCCEWHTVGQGTGTCYCRGVLGSC
jgi:hypothetical protein